MPWRDAPLVEETEQQNAGAKQGGWRGAPLVEQEEPGPATVPTPNLSAVPLIGPAAAGLGMTGAPTPEDSATANILRALDYVDNTGAITLEGAREGAANFAGLPVDIINAAPMLANLLPGVDGVGPMSEDPVGGSGSLSDLFSGYGLVPDAPEAQDPVQRVAGRLGEEMGAAAVPIGGLLALGSRLGTQAARSSGNPLVRMFAEPAAVSPSKFAAKEATYSAGAGIGAGTANETLGNQDRENPWIDALGALAGAALTGGGSLAGSALRDLWAGATGNPNYASRVVQENVADALISNSDTMSRQVDASDLKKPLDTTELVEAIGRPSEAEQVAPGFQATTADRAGDSGLAMLENARSRNNPGPYRAQSDRNVNAVEAAFRQLAPEEPPGTFSDELSATRDRRIGEAGAVTAQAEDRFSQATADLLPALSATGRGQEIRAALQDASDAAKAVMEEAWAPVNQSGENVDMDAMSVIFRDVDEGLSQAETQRFRPSEADIPKNLVQPGTADEATGVYDASGNMIMRPGAEPTAMQPLNEITGIRSALTDAQREAATAQRNNEARVIGQYIDAIDDYMTRNLPENLQEQYNSARAATADFKDRFARPQTAIAETLRERQGQPATDASTVPRKFVQPDEGRTTDFDALMREAGSDERVKIAVRDQVLQDVRDRGLIDKPEQLDQYLDQYGTVFERFPELREQLGDVSSLRRQVDQAVAYEQDLTNTLTKQGKSAVANYLSYGDERARDAMRGVMRSRDPAQSADELLTFVDDSADAVQGARAAFWENLDTAARSRNAAAETESGVMPLMPKKLLDFLDDPATEAVAARLYRDDPEHLENVRTLAEALRGVNTGPRVGGAANPSGTALTKMGEPPVTAAEAGSKLYQVQIGRASPLFVGTYLAGKLARRMVGSQRADAFSQLIDKALLDPEVARSLLQSNNPANRAALARKAKTWLGNEASTVINALTDEDEPQETE